jgi:hypothetical protein
VVARELYRFRILGGARGGGRSGRSRSREGHVRGDVGEDVGSEACSLFRSVSAPPRRRLFCLITVENYFAPQPAPGCFGEMPWWRSLEMSSLASQPFRIWPSFASASAYLNREALYSSLCASVNTDVVWWHRHTMISNVTVQILSILPTRQVGIRNKSSSLVFQRIPFIKKKMFRRRISFWRFLVQNRDRQNPSPTSHNLWHETNIPGVVHWCSNSPTSCPDLAVPNLPLLHLLS